MLNSSLEKERKEGNRMSECVQLSVPDRYLHCVFMTCNSLVFLNKFGFVICHAIGTLK